MVAVVVPAGIAREVAVVLRHRDADGPILAVAGEDPHWVFLADPNGYIATRDELPDDVVVLGCPAAVPIPAVDSRCDDVRWVLPPDPRRRWLPTLAAVLAGVRCRDDGVGSAAGSRAVIATARRDGDRP